MANSMFVRKGKNYRRAFTTANHVYLKWRIPYTEIDFHNIRNYDNCDRSIYINTFCAWRFVLYLEDVDALIQKKWLPI